MSLNGLKLDVGPSALLHHGMRDELCPTTGTAFLSHLGTWTFFAISHCRLEGLDCLCACMAGLVIVRYLYGRSSLAIERIVSARRLDRYSLIFCSLVIRDANLVVKGNSVSIYTGFMVV